MGAIIVILGPTPTYTIPTSLHHQLANHLPFQLQAFGTSILWQALATVPPHALLAHIQNIVQPDDCRVVVLPQPTRPLRLLALDMDGTILTGESLTHLAHIRGLNHEVEKLTEQAMRGEIDFTSALHARLKLLQPIHREELATIHHHVQLTPYASELMRMCQHWNIRTALITGGFDITAQAIADELSIDDIFANVTHWHDDATLRGLGVPLIDAEQKRHALTQWALMHHVDMSQVMAIGDGANDIPMLQAAAFGLGFNAKPIVKQALPDRCISRFEHAAMLIDLLQQLVQSPLSLPAI